MRNLFYLVNGKKIANYDEARKLQPNGQLYMVLENEVEETASKTTRDKRIAKRKAAKFSRA